MNPEPELVQDESGEKRQADERTGLTIIQRVDFKRIYKNIKPIINKPSSNNEFKTIS